MQSPSKSPDRVACRRAYRRGYNAALKFCRGQSPRDGRTRDKRSVHEDYCAVIERLHHFCALREIPFRAAMMTAIDRYMEARS